MFQNNLPQQNLNDLLFKERKNHENHQDSQSSWMKKNNSPQKNSISDVNYKGVNFNFLKDQMYDKTSIDFNDKESGSSGFQFKLTQIPTTIQSENESTNSLQNVQEKNQKSKNNSSQLNEILVSHVREIDIALNEKRVYLLQAFNNQLVNISVQSQNFGFEQLQDIINSSFDQLRDQNRSILKHLKSYDSEQDSIRSQKIQLSKKINSPLKQKSPVKGEQYQQSPGKKKIVNDENISPSKQQDNLSPSKECQRVNFFSSPINQNQLKENGSNIKNQSSSDENNNKDSHQLSRKKNKIQQSEEELNEKSKSFDCLQNKNEESSKNLESSQENLENEILDQVNLDNEQNNCRKNSLPKSPVKRMKNLEEKFNKQEEEDVETTYKKSPEKALTSEQVSANQEEYSCEQKESLPQKALLGSEEQYQKPILTLFQAQQAENSLAQQENQIDLTEIFEVDSNVINYGQFICGKILGSTLFLRNQSENEQVITMSISQQMNFNCDSIFGQYNRDELPFTYEDGSLIKNSEIEFNCWFIENPQSKELQKQITMKIAPKMSQEFIIVVKAPKNRLQSRIVSFIDIQLNENLLPSEKSTENGKDGIKKAIEKHLDHKNKEVILKNQFKKVKKLEVLLLGYLDNPKIKCMKQLFNKASNSEMISIAVKKTGGVQKFKLPFKNLSTYLDSELEFAFIRTSANQQNSIGSKEQQKQNSQTIDPIECLQFICSPNQIKISADQIQILTVQVKVNNELLQDSSKVDQKSLKFPLNKLLVARLKNSQVLFSYFVSITLLE